MKKLNLPKKYITVAALAAFAVSLSFADEIELGEVTTLVTNDSNAAEKDAVPDFRNVLNVKPADSKIVPVLPQIEDSGKTGVSQTTTTSTKEIFAQGIVGGGYPVDFFGNLSLYTLGKENRFALKVNHNSSAGYAGKNLEDGYYNRQTGFSFDKAFSADKDLLVISGEYEALGYGLQNNSASASYFNQDYAAISEIYKHQFNDNFVIGAKFSSNYYDHYQNVSDSSLFVSDLSPLLFVRFHKNSLSAGFTAAYWYDYFSKSQIDNAHRGQFLAEAAWTLGNFKLSGDVAAVLSNKMNKGFILVPFHLGASYSLPVSFSDRNAVFALKGGLNSRKNDVSDLERRFRFAALSVEPYETADWFGSVDFSLPVQNLITIFGLAEFRKTAFDAGVIQPVYSSAGYSSANGLYGYEMADLTQLKIEGGISYSYEWLTLEGSWKSSWIDLPVLENRQTIKAAASIETENQNYGANASAEFYIGDYDCTPLISFGGFAVISQSAQVLLSIDDVIKLVSASTRDYAGQYVQRGGAATLSIKFNF